MSITERFCTKAPFDDVRSELEASTGKAPRMCRWCGKTDLPPRRYSWCSQDCVNEYLLRSSKSYIRMVVRKRDRGICDICKLDTYRFAREMRERYGLTRYYWVALDDLGFNVRMSLWVVDHIKPVYAGGGQCGLDNLRTLCVPCHKKVTAEQAKQRKKTVSPDEAT